MIDVTENDSDDLYVGTEFSADQGTSETLTGDNTQDPLEAGYTPPERPNKSWRGETAEEDRDGESLDEKLAEEEPEVSEADLENAWEDDRAGRLVAPDEGAHADEEADEIATDVGRAGYAATAEEAAMHISDGPEDEG